MSLSSKLAFTMLASAWASLALALLVRPDSVSRGLQLALLMSLLAVLIGRPLGARWSRRDHGGERAREGSQRARHEASGSTLEELRESERLITVGQLAAGIAHELGTPLHVVIARGKRILRREVPDSQTAHDAESIVHEGERMSRLIQQLLSFSRPRTPGRAPVELDALVHDVAALLTPMADARGVRLATRAAGVGVIEGDRDGLAEVLTNLGLNAIQATDPGRRVELAVLEPIALEGAPGGRYARVAVSDEGHGIPSRLRQRIFEPFFTTREVGEGTGLGLSVAWGIVREHRGFIDVESEPGVGSRFTVHLPLPERTRSAPASAA